tara:strand:- start:678 stop:1160 length:483 start_codon:yes stop_codon:yes gene_type:complete
MSKGPLNFGALMTPSSMFGSMGNNQMINSLSNANAIAAAQAQQAASSMQPQGSGVTDMSNTNGTNNMFNQQIKTPAPIFDPNSQAAAMGMFGGSGLMKKEPAADPCSPEFDYDVASNPPHNMTAKQIKEARKKCKDNSETEESSAKRDESMSRGAQGENN